MLRSACRRSLDLTDFAQRHLFSSWLLQDSWRNFAELAFLKKDAIQVSKIVVLAQGLGASVVPSSSL